jgi:hypothetical protein
MIENCISDNCPHCDFIHKTFKNITTNYEYWLMTEVFVYLHDGKDYCNEKLESN